MLVLRRNYNDRSVICRLPHSEILADRMPAVPPIADTSHGPRDCRNLESTARVLFAPIESGHRTPVCKHQERGYRGGVRLRARRCGGNFSNSAGSTSSTAVSVADDLQALKSDFAIVADGDRLPPAWHLD
jgi:hypothetical protein